MSNPWTPGPWIATKRDKNFELSAANDPNALIGEVYGWCEDAPEEATANARLIAAAPLLLDALASLIGRYGGTIAVASDDPRAIAAIAAIAAAKGDAP